MLALVLMQLVRLLVLLVLQALRLVLLVPGLLAQLVLLVLLVLGLGLLVLLVQVLGLLVVVLVLLLGLLVLTPVVLLLLLLLGLLVLLALVLALAPMLLLRQLLRPSPAVPLFCHSPVTAILWGFAVAKPGGLFVEGCTIIARRERHLMPKRECSPGGDVSLDRHALPRQLPPPARARMGGGCVFDIAIVA